MTLSTYRNSPFWKAAIDLGPALARLADDLPASEEFGLSHTLRQLAVELPAAIAGDLITEGATTRYPVILKLAAALELVERVYPALDTAGVRTSADALAEQLLAASFSPTAAPAPALVANAAAAELEFATPAAPAAPAAPVAPSAAPAAPVAVPITAEAPAAPSLAVQPVPVQESHVQSDSQE